MWRFGLALAGMISAPALAQEIPLPAKPAMPTPALRSTLPESMLAAPTPMVFRLGRFEGSPGCGLACAEFIYASGEMRPDSVEALMILFSRLKRPLPVYFNSPGGNLDGGLALGRAIRGNAGATEVATLTALPCRPGQPCTEADQRGGIAVFSRTVTPGLCNSACVYAFAGGVRRTVSEGSSLGIHRYFLARADDPYRRPLQRYGRQDAARLDRSHDAIAAYLAEMGVSPETLRMASSVEPHDVRHLTTAEASQLGLTTPPAFAEIARQGRDPSPVAALRAMVAPPAQPLWPMVTRAGRPFLVVSQPAESRRFGKITTELAISCAGDSGRYALAFRELVVSRPDKHQDARIRVEPDETAELRAREPLPTLLRDTAIKADERGVLVLEITSSATAGHPMRLEFPGHGLREGIERLDRACAR